MQRDGKAADKTRVRDYKTIISQAPTQKSGVFQANTKQGLASCFLATEQRQESFRDRMFSYEGFVFFCEKNSS